MKHNALKSYTKNLKSYSKVGWEDDNPCLVPASLLERWYALTIDIAMFFPLYLLCKIPFERSVERLVLDPGSLKAAMLPILIGGIPWLFYFYLPTLFWGQTFGKKAVGIFVIATPLRHRPLVIFWRETVGKLLTVMTFGIGFLLALYHPRKKTLHDLISNTSVISFPLYRGKGTRSLL